MTIARVEITSSICRPVLNHFAIVTLIRAIDGDCFAKTGLVQSGGLGGRDGGSRAEIGDGEMLDGGFDNHGGAEGGGTTKYGKDFKSDGFDKDSDRSKDRATGRSGDVAGSLLNGLVDSGDGAMSGSGGFGGRDDTGGRT